MGRQKASLPFGDGSLLEWMIALVRDAAPDVWVSVSRDANSPLPRGAAGFLVDREPGAGPLAALRGALARFDRPVLFVACDLPFLAPSDLRALAGAARVARNTAPMFLLGDSDGPQPLAALYRPLLLPTIDALLAAGRDAMRDLLAAAPHETILATPRVAGCPPLANLNRPREYDAALAAARAGGLFDQRAAPKTSRAPRGASPRRVRGRGTPSPRA